jgi:FkbM family methyltransferase
MNTEAKTESLKVTGTAAAGASAAGLARSVNYLNPRLWLTELGRAACQCWPLNAHRGWVRRTFRHWCVDEELVVTTKAGFRMAVSPANYVSYGIYFYGEYDAPMTQALTRLVHPGETVWDVGTERGWFSCLLAQLVGPTGRVDSFEAFPVNAARLRRNIELNGMDWVRTHQVAISDRPGEAVFQLPTPAIECENSLPENCSGIGYLTDRESSETIRVPTVTLDQYALDTGLESLTLIKMDIEGAEVRALRGALQVLRKHRPILAVEYNRLALRRAGSSWEELDRLLAELGYDRYTYNGAFETVRLSDWDDVPDRRASFNVYAFPREL